MNGEGQTHRDGTGTMENGCCEAGAQIQGGLGERKWLSSSPEKHRTLGLERAKRGNECPGDAAERLASGARHHG